MLHTILRNAPFFILIISMVSFGALNIATAETTDTTGTSTGIRGGTGTRVPTRDNPVRTNMPYPDPGREAFQERAAELRTNAKARTDALETRVQERRTRISETIENRVRTVITNVKTRIAATIEKLGSIADRIESRAKKIAERGVNVDTALTFVAQARVGLRAASVIMNEDLAAEVDAAVTSEEPKAAFKYVKDSTREAHVHIMAAQKALRDAVAALKEATKPKIEH
jgi:hypothetical protein